MTVARRMRCLVPVTAAGCRSPGPSARRSAHSRACGDSVVVGPLLPGDQRHATPTVARGRRQRLSAVALLAALPP
jgi:hypothetical protein